jgi:thiamine-phosphate pyrophosphorylase
MRPLPRLLAFTDRSIRIHPDLAGLAAAIAALGPAAGLVARDPDATAAELTALAARLLAIAGPADAAVIVSGRPDIAAGLHAQGVQLRAGDLSPGEARQVLPHGWIGRSVHSGEEGTAAVAAGADYLVAGPIWATPSHPGRPATGLGLIRTLAALGRPVFAIGGVTPARAGEALAAGAWGVAAISAVWVKGEADDILRSCEDRGLDT